MEDRIEEEKITIKLNEKEKDDKLQLGKIDNIKAFNDMLKYTKKYKNKNGVYITFDEGILDISNRERLVFQNEKCYYNGIDMYYDAVITKVKNTHMLEIWIENDRMIRVFFELCNNKMYFPKDYSIHTVINGCLIFRIKFLC